jgi:hypothetical protein
MGAFQGSKASKNILRALKGHELTLEEKRVKLKTTSAKKRLFAIPTRPSSQSLSYYTRTISHSFNLQNPRFIQKKTTLDDFNETPARHMSSSPPPPEHPIPVPAAAQNGLSGY